MGGGGIGPLLRLFISPGLSVSSGGERVFLMALYGGKFFVFLLLSWWGLVSVWGLASLVRGCL